MNVNSPKKWAWLAALSCAACCAIIPVLMMIGVTTAIGLSWYFEVAAIGFFVLSVALFGYAALRNKSTIGGSTCSTDCNSKQQR